MMTHVRINFQKSAMRRASLACGCSALCMLIVTQGHAADFPVKAPPVPYEYDWTGFYVGGTIGVAAGRSNWNAAIPNDAPAAGSFGLYNSPNAFSEGGSWQIGIEGGYNYMLKNRLVLGVEGEVNFPTFPDLNGLTTGGVSNFNSVTLGGASSFSETMLWGGSLRGRIGYAPGSWMFYATGGFAWTYNMQTLALGGGSQETPYLWRLGWTAGAGVEVAVAPSWTFKGEFLWSQYPTTTTDNFWSGVRVSSDWTQQEYRIGLNYHFDDPSQPAADAPSKFVPPIPDIFSVHGQATFVDQAYPAFRSPYEGPQSLSGGGSSRETFDITLATGVKLWQGAEFWADPEVDQGFGFDNTHGAAGFPSAESYKLGSATPYARIQRAFLRQTIDLGGDAVKVDDDFNQFAQTTTTDRLVLTVGHFAIVDIFDTNKYANNPKSDFLNWSMINTGTFDYAGDAWGYTYGAAAEWYTGRWTFRGGVFDLSDGPAGSNTPIAYSLDPTFQQFELVGEVEERHELWGQPGKIKITGFLERGMMGQYSDAVALAAMTGQPAALNPVRTYTSRPGVDLNLEQSITDTVALFGRAGWADGHKEPWDFTDIDQTVQAGVSINGKLWNRPDDTVGVAGVMNGISNAAIAYFNAGGLGILIGDGTLTNYSMEKIIEAYYSYALTASVRLTFDYQYMVNPGYNADRGPANIFAGRAHWQF
jgi:high affinity Mn2+ porin